MSSQRATINKKLKVAAFLCLHILIVGAVIGWAAVRYQDWERAKELPALRLNPLTVKPEYDRPEIVSDADLGSGFGGHVRRTAADFGHVRRRTRRRIVCEQLPVGATIGRTRRTIHPTLSSRLGPPR